MQGRQEQRARQLLTKDHAIEWIDCSLVEDQDTFELLDDHILSSDMLKS